MILLNHPFLFSIRVITINNAWQTHTHGEYAKCQ